MRTGPCNYREDILDILGDLAVPYNIYKHVPVEELGKIASKVLKDKKERWRVRDFEKRFIFYLNKLDSSSG